MAEKIIQGTTWLNDKWLMKVYGYQKSFIYIQTNKEYSKTEYLMIKYFDENNSINSTDLFFKLRDSCKVVDFRRFNKLLLKVQRDGLCKSEKLKPFTINPMDEKLNEYLREGFYTISQLSKILKLDSSYIQPTLIKLVEEDKIEIKRQGRAVLYSLNS